MFHRSRFAGALLALALALGPARAATTTTQVSLSTTAWTDLGAGPMLLGAVGGNVQYQVADSLPASSAPALGSVNIGQDAANLQVTSHVWARGSSVLTSAIVGAGTGVTGWGGTGGGGGGGGAITAASGSYSAGAFSAGAGVDGWNITEGAKADAAYAGSGSASMIAVLKGLYNAIISPLAAQTGAVWIGNVGQYNGTAWAITGTASTDGSASITTGGTAQNLFGGSTPTNGWEVCNPSATEEAWASDSTAAAANGQGSYRLGPNGGCYSPPFGSKPIGAVSVIAATTNHKLTARQW